MAEGFAAIPTWMFREHERVSIWGVMVFGALATRAGLRGNFPSQTTLAAEARCSERKVRDALRELEELGVVERVRRGGRGEGRLPDGYRLMDRPLHSDEQQPASCAGRGEQPAPDDRATGTSEQVAPLIEVDRSEVDKTPTPSGAVDLESLFEEAWKSWPKKTERKKSLEKFKRLARRHSPRDAYALTKVISKFGTAYAATTETRFVPALVVWLNGERWTDPLPEAQTSQRGTAVERMAARVRNHQLDEEAHRELGA